MNTTALVMAGPGVMIHETRKQRDLGVDEALIAVIATGICGSDIHGLAGATGRREPGQVMGHETVGRVVATGANVDANLVGALVTVNPVFSCGKCRQCLDGSDQQCAEGWVLGVRADVDAAFSERFTVPARNLVRLSDGTVDWHGALIEPLAVGYHAVRRGMTSADDKVLVIGGGPIGQAVAIAAKRVGVTNILVSEPDSTRAELLTRLGFRVVTPDGLDTVLEENLAGKATLVFDAVGAAQTLQTAFDNSISGARIVLVGMASPELKFSAYELSARERTLVGTFCYSREHFEETAQWVSENPAIVSQLVDRFVSLPDAPEIFSQLCRNELPANKILVRP
ncbi:MAG: alcohol dehydrogenase catalytic domain-containing protein [Actinomycetales bacterium]|nr:alcohol dehydrogenase catalytic domain-containing protein [Actinomycetales bacterium]